MSNADIARAGFAAIARGDFAAITEFLDADVKWHGGDPAAGCQNRAQALAWIRGRGARTGGAPLPELVDVVQAGERVVVVMQPQPSEGDPNPRRSANLASFRAGRVVEMVHYDDAERALVALAPAD